MNNEFPTKVESFFSKMIPFGLRFKIDSVIFDWISNNIVFSSDDVVKQLRDSSITKLPSPVLKAYIYDKMIRFQSYSRTLKQVSDYRFFVYAPFWADIEVTDYEPFQEFLKSATYRIKSECFTPHTSVPMPPVQSMKISPDKYNRLVIPKRVLSYLGFAPQQTVYIKKEPELNKVTVSPIPIDDTYIQRRVTKKGMIRISAATLDTDSIYTATADVENNRIYVVA